MAQSGMQNIRVEKEHLPGGPDKAPVAARPGPKNPNRAYLESPKADERLKRVLNWYHQERIVQAENRALMAKDQDYYDGGGLQTPDEVRAVLENRGQPANEFNVIAPVIRWITGTEKRTRVDYRVIPRGKEDGALAESKTKLLKYVSDVNKSAFERSRAFEDVVTAGIGWTEEVISTDPTEEPMRVRWEDWRNVLHDHLSRAYDMGDARFLFRWRWVDLDVAIAMFPWAKIKLESIAEENLALVDEQEFDTHNSQSTWQEPMADELYGWRKRVRLVLCEYREPEKVKIFRSGPLKGCLCNPADPTDRYYFGRAETADGVKMVMRRMLFATGKDLGHSYDNLGNILSGVVLLHDDRSPYRHNRFSLTPWWGYRRKRDGLPYGVVRNLTDPQDDYNHRRNKVNHLLSTKRTVMDEGAVDDVDEYADEVARPDGIIIKKQGKELRIETELQLAQANMAVMHEDGALVQSISGVTDEQMGRSTNAQSGKAIEARSNQGVSCTADLFDNYRQSFQLSGEKQLSLIEQFYDEPKVFRLLGGARQVEFFEVNQEQEDGSLLNDITASQADFVVDEESFNSSARAAMHQSMMDLITALAQSGMGEIALRLLDIAMDMSDFPMREELVRRIREINGQKDPAAQQDPEEAERERQAKEAEAQEIQQQKELALRTAMAQLLKLEGEAKRANAEGDLKRIQAAKEKLDAMMSSVDLAATLAVSPSLGDMADQIMADAARLLPPQKGPGA